MADDSKDDFCSSFAGYRRANFSSQASLWSCTRRHWQDLPSISLTGSFNSPESDEVEGVLPVFLEMFNFLGDFAASSAHEGEDGVAERGEGLGCGAGAHAANVFGEADIANEMQAIFGNDADSADGGQMVRRTFIG